MSGENEKSSQRDRFMQAATALGANEGEAAFKAKLAAIARHNPKPPLRSEVE